MRVLLALLVITLAPAALAADPDAGLELARKACAFCHVVEDGGRGSDAVPTFRSIAREAGDDIGALRSFTDSPHPQMPQFADLIEQQIENLIAYLKRLQE